MIDEVFTSQIKERSKDIKDLKEDILFLFFQYYWGECVITIVTSQMKVPILKLNDTMITSILTN